MDGWTDGCTDADWKGRVLARSLTLTRPLLTRCSSQAQRGVPTAACSCCCSLQAACCANPLSLAHIQLGHAVNWPQLQVRRYLHTPTDALTLLGPNASPSCYSTNFYSGESYAYLI